MKTELGHYFNYQQILIIFLDFVFLRITLLKLSKI
jgi:hypothetical protein